MIAAITGEFTESLAGAIASTSFPTGVVFLFLSLLVGEGVPVKWL